MVESHGHGQTCRLREQVGKDDARRWHDPLEFSGRRTRRLGRRRLLQRQMLRWRTRQLNEHRLGLLNERSAKMVFENLDSSRSVERVRRCVEDGKHRVLENLVFLQRNDLQFFLLQFLARDVSAVALKIAVGRQPVGNPPGLGFSVAVAFEHPVLRASRGPASSKAPVRSRSLPASPGHTG